MKKSIFIISFLFSSLLLANSNIDKQQCIEDAKSKADFEKCEEIGKILPPVISEVEKKRLYDEKKLAISHVNEVKDCIAKSYTSNELKKCTYKHEETKQVVNKMNKNSKINDSKVFGTKAIPTEESFEKSSNNKNVSKTQTKTKSNTNKTKKTKSNTKTKTTKKTDTKSQDLKMLF